MTFILTIVGLFVFAISCFTANFKTAWKRLVTFTITGIILDVILTMIYVVIVYVAFR